jgi:hypothetical protein
MQYAFKELLEKASMEVGQDGSHENITKELLHYDILRAFSESGRNSSTTATPGCQMT